MSRTRLNCQPNPDRRTKLSELFFVIYNRASPCLIFSCNYRQNKSIDEGETIGTMVTSDTSVLLLIPVPFNGNHFFRARSRLRMANAQVSTITKVTPSPQELKFVRGGPSTHRRDDYICTDCGGRSCGGVYSSLCTVCDGVSADPPRAIRRHYLCTECARRRRPCTCDTDRRPRPPPVPPTPAFVFRDPPEYCCCSCCTCCTYTCSCSYCHFFCECLSAPCRSFEPCCYCTRVCFPNQVCCQTRFCFWAWFPCACSPP